jgi:hypothetical protein
MAVILHNADLAAHDHIEILAEVALGKDHLPAQHVLVLQVRREHAELFQ